MEEARAGNPRAFDNLIKKHHLRLYSTVYHMTSNREDALDLVQDIFAKAYRSIGKFKGNSAFYTWLHTIGVNMTINHLKKKKRKFAFSLDDLDSGIQNDETMLSLASLSNPRKELDLKFLQKKLNEAMMELSEEHRLVVTMFDMQGLPHAQISEILGISSGTVRSRLFYAHKHLQAKLQSVKKDLQ